VGGVGRRNITGIGDSGVIRKKGDEGKLLTHDQKGEKKVGGLSKKDLEGRSKPETIPSRSSITKSREKLLSRELVGKRTPQPAECQWEKWLKKRERGEVGVNHRRKVNEKRESEFAEHGKSFKPPGKEVFGAAGASLLIMHASSKEENGGRNESSRRGEKIRS